MDAFGCGRCRGHSPPCACRRSQGIPTGDLDWLLRPTGHSWPAGAWTRRASCEIGRASCRGRGEISVVAVSFKKKKSKRKYDRDKCPDKSLDRTRSKVL